MLLKKAGFRLYLILGIILLLVFWCSLAVGRYPVPLLNTVKILVSPLFKLEPTWPKVQESVILNLRLPRVIFAVLSGFGLAVSGAALQGIFRNPLVSPGIIGVTSGAGFGAALGILIFGSGLMVQLFSFLSGLLAFGLTFAIARAGKGKTILVFILSGVIVNFFFQAVISLIKFLADSEDKLPSIVYWLMGSLSGAGYTHLMLTFLPITIGIVLLILMSWRINILSLGEETVKSLGLNYQGGVILTLGLTTLVVSSIVSVAGIIGWVGLIIPHMTRILFGTDHDVVLPAGGLLGAIFFLLIDDFARTVTAADIPLGILTAVIGAPFFALLLTRSDGEWSV